MGNSSLIESEVDLDLDGYQHGYLRLPHSVHRSAYGWIPIPIVSVKNGNGPVVLLLAGVHGDEFEGQVALTDLVQSLKPEKISGQVIILPMANFPAAQAGLRTSPIDEGNLNRSFPGDPQGGPTSAIAHYIESELLIRADYLLDIHSGGSSLRYETTLLMASHENAEKQSEAVGLLQSLGFSKAVLFPETPNGSFSSSAARRNNVIGITAEVAGGGNVDTQSLNILREGLLRYLHKADVLHDEYCPEMPNKAMRILKIESRDCYVFAREAGLFESLVKIGEQVSVGQIAGYIHHPDTPWKVSDEVKVLTQGEVVCMRFPALTRCGDCLFEVAENSY
ncbi:MAG: putative deacylase [Parasphingorhabdus sp.]|jgi:predicted deacylase